MPGGASGTPCNITTPGDIPGGEPHGVHLLLVLTSPLEPRPSLDDGLDRRVEDQLGRANLLVSIDE